MARISTATSQWAAGHWGLCAQPALSCRVGWGQWWALPADPNNSRELKSYKTGSLLLSSLAMHSSAELRVLNLCIVLPSALVGSVQQWLLAVYGAGQSDMVISCSAV